MDKSKAEIYHDLAFTEKSNYLKFIYDIGEKGLSGKFKFPGEDFSIWWFSRIVEKAPLKSDSYKDLISILAENGRRHPKKDIFTRFKETLPVQFLAGLYRICGFVIRAIYIKAAMKKNDGRKKSLAGQEYYIFSYFPLINERLAEEGIFENAYIATFHRILEERFQGRYSHILFQADINGCGLGDSVKLANKFAKRQSVFFLEEFFKLPHIIYLAGYYFYFSALFALNLRSLKGSVVYDYKGKSYNVWDIFKNDFYRSFCGPSLASSIWYILLFREAVDRINKNGKIICICEMQWWEKALYAYAKKRGITTIGVQHTIVPELLLNYFCDPREIGTGNFVEHCPFPDYMATVGKVPSDILTRSGWPSERVFTWGAQRFESLKGIMGTPVPWKDKDNYFVCVLSINISETRRFLSLIKKAFSGVENYRIVIRSHPAADLNKELRNSGITLDAPIFEYTSKPIQDVIQKAKGLIGVTSSSCLYALACDIPVIVPVFPDRIDYNPLSYITHIPVYVYSAEHLRSVCDRITASTMSPCVPDQNIEFLNDYLYFPENKGEYLEKINSL